MRSRTVCGRLHRPQPRTCMTSAQKVVSQDCRQLAHRAARQIWQTARFASAVTCQVTATNVAQPLCQMSWALYVGYRLPQLLKDDLNLSADVLTACREESILDSRAGYGGAVPSGGEVQRACAKAASGSAARPWPSAAGPRPRVHKIQTAGLDVCQTRPQAGPPRPGRLCEAVVGSCCYLTVRVACGDTKEYYAPRVIGQCSCC